MKRIMKTLGIVTIVALLLGSGTVIPVTATSEVTVSIDAPDEAAPGSDFTANVSISEVADFDGCNYDVSFDASVLRLDNVTSGLIGSTTIPVDIYNEISSGTYRIVQNIPGLAGVSGSGHLVVLHFHVVASAGHSSIISPLNGVLSDNMASEIKATWTGDSVGVTAAASEATTSSTAVNSSPEPTAPNKAAPLPAKPINWPVLWGVMGGIIVVGLVIFLLARRKAY